MRLAKLHKAILIEFFPLFLATIFVASFVFFMQYLWLYIDDFVGKEVSFTFYLQLFYYIALLHFPMSHPISIMTAGIITFGNLGERFELTAAKSAGISLYNIIKPIIVFGIISVFFIFFISETVYPYAHYKTFQLISSIRNQQPMMKIQEGIFNYDIPGYVIRVAKKDSKKNLLYGFMLYDHKTYENNRIVVTADSARITLTYDLKFLIIDLFHGSYYEEIEEFSISQKTVPYYINNFDYQQIVIPLKNFDFKKIDASFMRFQYEMLGIRDLIYKIDSLKQNYTNKRKFYLRAFLNNDFFRQKVMIVNASDSISLLRKLNLLDSLPYSSLKVPINLDSAISSQSISFQKSIVLTAISYAEEFYNRAMVYSFEGNSLRSWLVMHQITLYRKFVFSIACLIFVFIGAPLGSIIRKGGFGFPIIISTLLIIIYYLLFTIGEKLARSGTISAFNGSFLPLYVFIPLTLFFYYNAIRDNIIMHPEIIISNIKNFFTKFFKKI